MKSLKSGLFFLITLSTAGCSNYAMNSAIASWQNQNIKSAIAAWGTPSEELKLEGKQLYIWNTSNDILVAPNTRKPSSLKESDYCSRLLEADRNGTIVHGAWEGNDCPWIFSGWKR